MSETSNMHHNHLDGKIRKVRRKCVFWFDPLRELKRWVRIISCKLWFIINYIRCGHVLLTVQATVQPVQTLSLSRVSRSVEVREQGSRFNHGSFRQQQRPWRKGKRAARLDVLQLAGNIPRHFCSYLPQIRLGNSFHSPTIGGLVLEHLCPTIQNILEDGLRDHKLDLIIGQRRNHSWSVVEVSTRIGKCDQRFKWSLNGRLKLLGLVFAFSSLMMVPV